MTTELVNVSILYFITFYNFGGLSITEFQHCNRLLLNVYVMEDSSQQEYLPEELVLSQNKTSSTPPTKKARQEVQEESTVRFKKTEE